MWWRIVAAALAAWVVLLAASVTASALADPIGPVGHWGQARPISLTALGGVSGDIERMSCAAPGECSAAGTFHDASNAPHGFVVSEVKGTWGKPERIPGLDNVNKGTFLALTAMSCAQPGDCAVGGAYSTGTHGEAEPFVADSLKGHWGSVHTLAQVATGVNELTGTVTSISCTPRPQECVAGVTLPSLVPVPGRPAQVVGVAFIATETDGTWGHVQEIPTAPGQGSPSAINAVSCWEDGNCVAGGYFSDASGHEHALVVRENAGTWQTAQEVPGVTAVTGYNPGGDAVVQSVSCPDSICAVGGSYHDQAFHLQDFVADIGPDGQWHAQTVPGSLQLSRSGTTSATASCGVPGDCAFGSNYQAAGHTRVLLAVENLRNGSWSQAKDLSGAGPAASISEATLSCGGEGRCVSGGSYQADSTGRFVAYVADEIGGAWGPARRIAGNLDVGNSSGTQVVSCVTPGNCAAGGTYTDADGHQLPFVADEATVATASVSFSAAKAVYGAEQSDHIKVTVTPRAGGTPSGGFSIVVNFGSLCSGVLARRTATCDLTARQLRPGSYPVFAFYDGDQVYDSSQSSDRTLTVTKAPTSVGLTLSAASVKSGHESTEHLSVQVKPKTSGTPGGRVKITVGSVKLCVISLAKAKGTCSLTASQLRPGTYHLVASYLGSGPYAAAGSAKKTLTITK